MCTYITFHEVQDKIKGIASPYKNAVVRSFLVHELGTEQTWSSPKFAAVGDTGNHHRLWLLCPNFDKL